MSDEETSEEFTDRDEPDYEDIQEEDEEDESEKLEEKASEKYISIVEPETIPEPPEPEVDRILSKEEAGDCLTLLGRTGNGIDYAYLKIEAIDMDLTDISIIPSFEYVEFVDVSGNRLSNQDLYCLARMKLLVWLKAERNRIDSPILPELQFLQVLVLSKNKITSTAGIKQPILESLDLNYNQIKQVEDLSPKNLDCMRHLEMRGNALLTTAGISFPTLQSLYLAENKIDKLEDLEILVNLQKLHLRDNQLKKLDGFSNKLSKLTYINLRKNRIANMLELRKLKFLPMLETLVVLENPFTLDVEEEYRVEILVHLPNLKRIDKGPVQRDETEEAKVRREELGSEDENEGEEEVGEEASPEEEGDNDDD